MSNPKGISRQLLDIAGGLLVAPPIQNFCFVDNFPIAVFGQTVSPHGINEHSSSTMTVSSNITFVNNIPLVREGDMALCGHPSSGSVVSFSQ